jgi:ketosteroid isomerase-like protein
VGPETASLPFALGEMEDLILGLYGAFRRQDLDELVAGMHPEASFQPVTSARVYRGRDEIRRLFEVEIHTLAEFDFRVITVQERGNRALLHGRNRIWADGGVHDAAIYWVAESRDGMLHSFEPFTAIEDATAAFSGPAAG